LQDGAMQRGIPPWLPHKRGRCVEANIASDACAMFDKPDTVINGPKCGHVIFDIDI